MRVKFLHLLLLTALCLLAGCEKTPAPAPLPEPSTPQIQRAAIENITVRNVDIQPAFDSGQFVYQGQVKNDQLNAIFTVTLKEGEGKLTINGEPAASGEKLEQPLKVGDNQIDIALDNGMAVTTYRYQIHRLPSNIADLESLKLSHGKLTPKFSAKHDKYQARVPFSVEELSLTAKRKDSDATLHVNGQASDKTDITMPLDVGANSIGLVVTAQDGKTQHSYLLTIIREEYKSDDANLSSLSISSGDLTPAFHANKQNYTAQVDHPVNELVVQAIANHGAANVSINGKMIQNDEGAHVPLKVGKNTIRLRVTAEDGSKKSYNLHVTRRALSKNVLLKKLAIQGASLNEKFQQGQKEYTATVASSVQHVLVTPVADDEKANVSVNGKPVVSGQPSDKLSLKYGHNSVKLTVTAEDKKAKQHYIIDLARETPLALKGLAISVGSLEPAFNSKQTTYTANVGYLSKSIQIAELFDLPTGAQVLINGKKQISNKPSEMFKLSEGENSFEIVLYGVDKVNKKVYRLNVNRETADHFAGEIYFSGPVPVANARLDYTAVQSGDMLVVKSLQSVGEIMVFKQVAGRWQLETTINNKHVTRSDAFGDSLALDGNTLIAGASGKGDVYVYSKQQSGEWGLQEKLNAKATGIQFGASVAVKGETLAIGAPGEDSGALEIDGNEVSDCDAKKPENCSTDSGAAYVYARKAGHWKLQAYIKGSGLKQGDRFGHTVALSGDTLAVGTYDAKAQKSGVPGKVYVFKRSKGEWEEE